MPSIGKIKGLCADYSKPTVNGRPYDKIFERLLAGKDTRYNTMMQRGGIPCELGHPVDFVVDEKGNLVPRTETDPTKIAVILTDIRRGDRPKTLVASGNICDTPNGKIFKTLSEFYDFGLSSRGSYEVPDEEDDLFNFQAEGPDGWNQDSYIFKGFDLVLLPANPASVLSATESVGPSNKKRVVKVARESIDVNLLAKASQVSEDQVEEALDQLFKVADNPKKSEEITISEMKDELEKTADGAAPVEETEVNPEEGTEDEEEKEIETTSITNGEDVDKIGEDLQKALDEVKALTEAREKDGIELSNRNAEIGRLTEERDNLQSELDERIAESESLVEKMEALKELSTKLLESYKAAKAKFEEGQADTSAAAEEGLKELRGQVEEERTLRKTAEESLSRERNISKALRGELAAAKESLIGVYSTTYGVSTEAIKSSLGNKFTISKIKTAAESLADQAVRYGQMPVYPVVQPKRMAKAATESFEAMDEIERELYMAIQNDENK